MAEAINLHKRMAMRGPQEALHLKKGGAVKGITGNINDSAQKKPLPTPVPHAIATMKKGGRARKG